MKMFLTKFLLHIPVFFAGMVVTINIVALNGYNENYEADPAKIFIAIFLAMGFAIGNSKSEK